MSVKLCVSLVIVLLANQAAGAERDDLNKIIWAKQSDTQVEPDQYLEVLLKYQKNFVHSDSKDVQKHIDRLIQLNDSDYCEKESLYDYRINDLMYRLLEYSNLSRYVYKKFTERLEDGCREGDHDPDFMYDYEKKMGDLTDEQEHKKYVDGLWSAFYDSSSEMEPADIYKLMQNLSSVVTNDRTTFYLKRLLSLTELKYNNCPSVDRVLKGYVRNSWLSLPKVAKYIEHYVRIAREDCDWFLSKPEERKTKAVPVQVDCDQLTKSEELGLKRTFSQALAIQQDPSLCGAEMNSLANYVVQVSTCSGMGCCSSATLRRNIQSMQSTTNRHDITKLSSLLLPIANQICHSSV